METYIRVTRERLEALQDNLRNATPQTVLRVIADFVQHDLQDGINNLHTAESLAGYEKQNTPAATEAK